MVTVVAGFLIVLGNFIFLCFKYIIGIINVRNSVLSTNPFYILFFTIFPAIWWLYSTKVDPFNFYNRKNATLRLVIINDLLVLSQTIWSFVFNIAVYRICRIPVGRNFSEEMVLNLCRMTLVASSIGFSGAMYAFANSIMASPEIEEGINTFRWQHIVDDRKNISHLYDLQIIRHLETGRKIAIKEIDRFVHQFILGQSGTGKTSSTFLPEIVCDLNKKLSNMLERHRALLRLIKKKEAKVVPPEYGLPIDEYSVVAEPGFENKLKKIRRRYPDCGLTVMAPNGSMNGMIISLAKARGQHLNVVDPAANLTDKSVSMMGLNPLYIPKGLSADDRQIMITNLAQNFADVLLAVSEIHGVGDQYFRDINASVTTNAAVVCMLDASLRGMQTDIRELQACIADFTRLRDKILQIQRAFKIKINIAQPDSKQKPQQKGRAEDKEKQSSIQTSTIDFLPVTEKEVPESFKALGWTAHEYAEYLHKQAVNYYPSINFVLQELLGPGSEKMYDQARGLRNIINNLLLDPRIADILSADEEHMLNFDRILYKNEITVINTALEFGAQSSTALGIFIMLNLKLAVMRRARFDESDRTPHFLYIDEASQYMHPMYEDMFALFRQYRVAVTLALQSLSQMEKTPITRYLKGVIMGAGIHIVFGRVNSDEMKIYEEMAGMENHETIQTQVNSNSEFDENYSVTKGQRVTVTRESAMEGTKIRIRDFQEVTVFMIDRGRVMKGFTGKLNFPKKSEYKMKKNVEGVDFSRYADSAVPAMGKEALAIEEAKREAAKEDVKMYQTSISSTERQDEYLMNKTSLPVPGEDIKAVPKITSEEARKRVGRRDQYMEQVKSDVFENYQEQEEEYSSEELVEENRQRFGNNVGTGQRSGVQRAENIIKQDSVQTVANDNYMDANFAGFTKKNMNPVQSQPTRRQVVAEGDDLDELIAQLDGTATIKEVIN